MDSLKINMEFIEESFSFRFLGSTMQPIIGCFTGNANIMSPNIYQSNQVSGKKYLQHIPDFDFKSFKSPIHFFRSRQN